MHSPTEENYLKALYNLADDKGLVNVNELSQGLMVKMPTITSMMKKLCEKKLVHYESYKPLRLTEKGKKAARLIIRKHRLTEMFLVEKMGFGWESVHEIAEQMEHIKSPAFFDKMAELLGHPELDPHGSPIPDVTGKIKPNNFVKASDCEIGESLLLKAVEHTSTDFLTFLNQKGLKLGSRLKIISIEPFDKSMVIMYNKRTETFSNLVCEKLLVQKK